MVRWYRGDAFATCCVERQGVLPSSAPSRRLNTLRPLLFSFSRLLEYNQSFVCGRWRDHADFRELIHNRIFLPCVAAPTLPLLLALHLLSPFCSTNIDVLVNQIVFEEPLISEARKPQLKRLVNRLIEKLSSNDAQDFSLHKILRAHILPLTNCAFNKTGDKCVHPPLCGFSHCVICGMRL